MYTFIKTISTRQLLMEQVPAFVLSLVVAETFYKFHSFTLECLAFLMTWYVFDMATGFALKNTRK